MECNITCQHRARARAHLLIHVCKCSSANTPPSWRALTHVDRLYSCPPSLLTCPTSLAHTTLRLVSLLATRGGRQTILRIYTMPCAGTRPSLPYCTIVTRIALLCSASGACTSASAAPLPVLLSCDPSFMLPNGRPSGAHILIYSLQAYMRLTPQGLRVFEDAPDQWFSN
jgi:hypothetical protein